MATPEVNDGGNVVKYTGPKPRIYGEQMIKIKTSEEWFKNDPALKDVRNLVGTYAGKQAISMAEESHNKYGTGPGMIAAEIWNPYAKAHGGKEISGSISVKDAMNSITTYTVREQAEAKRAQAEELRANSETGEKPEQGI